MYIVYQHKNKLNNKNYFGITKRKPEERWGKNGCNYKSSPHFYSAIQKYGWNNFEHNILFNNLTKEEACLKEQELIAEYNSNNRLYGYNETSGGEYTIMTQASRDKLSKSMMGNKNNVGRIISEETKEKIRQSNLGQKRTDEAKKHMSEAASKRHVPCSEDKRNKLRQSYPYQKKIYCLETDTVYNSVQECSRELNIDASGISAACKRKIKKWYKGYTLRYYNNIIKA